MPTPPQYTTVHNGPHPAPPSPGSQNIPGERLRQMLFNMSWPHQPFIMLTIPLMLAASDISPNPTIPHSPSHLAKLSIGLKPAIEQYPQLSTVFPPISFSSSLPLPISLSQSPQPSSHVCKKDFKLAKTISWSAPCLGHTTNVGTVLGSFGETGRGRMQTQEGQVGEVGCSGSLWTSQVLILYHLQWLPRRILTWSQRMRTYPPPHLNPYQQHRLKTKAQCFSCLNHEKKILLIK